MNYISSEISGPKATKAPLLQSHNPLLATHGSICSVRTPPTMPCPEPPVCILSDLSGLDSTQDPTHPGVSPTSADHTGGLPPAEVVLNRFTVTESMNLQDYDECFESQQLALEAYHINELEIQVKHTNTRIATNNTDLANTAQIVSSCTLDTQTGTVISSLECLH